MKRVAALLLAAFPALAQAAAPLPQAARDAVDRGMAAAKSADYALAVRSFEEARTIAPGAPVVLFDLGLAESHLPGRELRAIAWYAAFLAAEPAASNAAAVKAEIARLRVSDRENLVRVIRSAKDAAAALGVQQYLISIAGAEAGAGNLAAALEMASGMENPTRRAAGYATIAVAQAGSGDVAGARVTLARVDDAEEKFSAQTSIVRMRAAAGDVGTAREIWGEMSATVKPALVHYTQGSPASVIAEAQTKAGDRAGARATIATALEGAKVIADAQQRDFAYMDLVEAMARDGDVAGARKVAALMEDAGSRAGTLGGVAASCARNGNVPKALEIASTILVEDEYGFHYRDSARGQIAAVQAGRGDLAGAKKTVALIRDPLEKESALEDIAEAIKPKKPELSPVGRWVAALDDTSPENDGALKMPIFLDLPAHLTSLASDDLETTTVALLATVHRMSRARSAVDGLLKQQGLDGR